MSAFPARRRPEWPGTCIACLERTDTQLRVHGDDAWHSSVLNRLRIARSEAIAIAQSHREAGRYERTYRVCVPCAGHTDELPTPVLGVVGPASPTVSPVPLVLQP